MEKKPHEQVSSMEKAKDILQQLFAELEPGEMGIIERRTGYSRYTVYVYMHGTVKNIHTAMEIIKTARELIAERKAILG